MGDEADQSWGRTQAETEDQDKGCRPEAEAAAESQNDCHSGEDQKKDEDGPCQSQAYVEAEIQSRDPGRRTTEAWQNTGRHPHTAEDCQNHEEKNHHVDEGASFVFFVFRSLDARAAQL